jgi:hypothetical protein
MDVNDLRNIVTVFSFVMFLALAIWTWMPSRRRALDEAAHLVFDGEAEEPGPRPAAAATPPRHDVDPD